MRSTLSQYDVERIARAPLVPVPPPLPAGAAAPAKPDPRPPFMAARLPEYGSLVYLEKLGLVVLTVAALAYLVMRTVQGGPVRGIEAAASVRGVRG